jgi:hypothetical protein
MDKEQLTTADRESLTQLREHPKMIWTRNNFFLLSQTGLLAFTLNITNQADRLTRVTGCAAGLFLTLMWLWVNVAGRIHQRTWRAVVKGFEKELFGEGQGPLTLAGEGGDWRKSITLILILLSVGFALIWVVLLFHSLTLA